MKSTKPCIKYAAETIPDFTLLPYTGQTYQEFVPDTLDIHERARLALHALTEVPDPDAGYEIYFIVNFLHNPASMQHNWHDPLVQPKFVEAIPLLRLITGSDENLEVESRLMEHTLRNLGPDGLSYIPIEGRPWCEELKPYKVRPGIPGQYLSPFACGRTLSAMTVLAMRDPNGPWGKAARSLADALINLAVEHDDYAFFWPSATSANKEKPQPGQVPTEEENGESSRVPHGLVHNYKLTGYEPALRLAGKIIRYMRNFFFDKDGSFLNSPGNPVFAHFHEHSHGLLAMADYCDVSGDQETLDFVSRSFLKSMMYSNDLMGYFPEFVNSREWEGSELCEVADMISLALKLSEMGALDCWDSADRWIRNMFAEGQLTSTDWIKEFPYTHLTNPENIFIAPSKVDPFSTQEKVAWRNLGSFAGWPAVNDWYIGNGPAIMHCCTGNAAQALYRIWEQTLTVMGDQVRINLLLNHASKWAGIHSHIPYIGQVDIYPRQACRLAIRIPEWVQPGEVRCQVNDMDRPVAWDGRYALAGSVNPGEKIVMTFPINERRDVIQVEKQQYRIVRRGNEVVFIDPPGRHCPLYQRQYLRTPDTRWRKIQRFISSEEIRW
jgi:hypothetical protein